MSDFKNRKKVFTERVIVATSQFFTTDYTKELYASIKQDGVPFTFLTVFDGTPKEKIDDLSSITDVGLTFKDGVHSLPEIFNSIFNLAKSSDAEFLMFASNDLKFKAGSFKRLIELTCDYDYDVISPVKIDKDLDEFQNYNSQEDIVEVIGACDSTFLLRLEKIDYNPIKRYCGPFNFENVDFMYTLWKKGLKFVIDPQAVVFHHCSKDTPFCFSVEERARYSSEWNLKKDFFLANNGSDAKWFIENVAMNPKNIERFGYPAYINEE